MASRLTLLLIASLSSGCGITCYNEALDLRVKLGDESLCAPIDAQVDDFVLETGRYLGWTKKYIRSRIGNWAIQIHDRADDEGTWWVDYEQADGTTKKTRVAGQAFCDAGFVLVGHTLRGLSHELTHAVDWCQCAIEDDAKCSVPGVSGQHAGWIETNRYRAIDEVQRNNPL